MGKAVSGEERLSFKIVAILTDYSTSSGGKAYNSRRRSSKANTGIRHKLSGLLGMGERQAPGGLRDREVGVH